MENSFNDILVASTTGNSKSLKFKKLKNKFTESIVAGQITKYFEK